MAQLPILLKLSFLVIDKQNQTIKGHFVGKHRRCQATADVFFFFFFAKIVLKESAKQFLIKITINKEEERKKEKKTDERKNVQTTSTPTYCKRNWPLPYYYPY